MSMSKPTPSHIKRKTWALVALSLLPLVVTTCALPLLPDIVAFHFGADGAPDSWKPREYLLVMPLFCAFLMLACTY